MKTLPPTTINGQPVLAVEETTKSQGIALSDVVYIKATGMPLPVESWSPSRLQAKIVYGPWNKPPKAAVPAKSVPFQSSWIAKSSYDEESRCQGRRLDQWEHTEPSGPLSSLPPRLPAC